MRSLNWWQVVLPENWQIAGFGLYIHWPFCAAKCPYCDFNSHVVSAIDSARWKRAYLAEIARLGRETGDRVLSSVFFGGGTPSMMEVGLIAEILAAVRSTWKTANDFEVTLEANPTSVEAGRFAGYRDAGVNRVSVGIQALNDADLKALGRLHSVFEAVAALDIARHTFERVSFDLIYARQNQTLQSWTSELERALSMSPTHLSMYQLTIESGTAFGDRFKRGRLPGLPDEDLGADLYQATQDLCDAAGLPAYEVSNHAQSGAECRHNLIYWQSGDFAGIGPGAHGRLSFAGARYATETALAPSEWLQHVETRGSGELSRTEISPADQDIEMLLMGLRISQGVDLSRMNDPQFFLNNISVLEEHGFIHPVDNRLIVTPSGRPILNSVLQELIRDPVHNT